MVFKTLSTPAVLSINKSAVRDSYQSAKKNTGTQCILPHFELCVRITGRVYKTKFITKKTVDYEPIHKVHDVTIVTMQLLEQVFVLNSVHISCVLANAASCENKKYLNYYLIGSSDSKVVGPTDGQ